MEKTSSLSRRKFIKTILAAGSAAAVNWNAFSLAASGVKDKNKFAVVVIGAGLGGLVSAAYLSKYGFDVTVVEQHSIPGGYATSFDREQGKYSFDVSLHATVAEHAMPQKILEDLGIWNKLRMVNTPELRRIITSSFDITLPAKNPEGVKEELSKVFPHEKKGIYAFYSEMEQVIAELWKRKRFKTSMMGKLENLTLEQWMSNHVKDPDVKYCMAIFSGYYGQHPSQLNALFYAIATGEYLVLGGQYYKTRSQDLSDTLAKAIEDNGGRILYNTEVDQILFDKNQSITGVLDSQKKLIPAKAVIANSSVPALLNQMVPKDLIPKSFSQSLRHRKPSISSFVVWLGLKKELECVNSYEISIRAEQGQAGDLAASGIGVTLYDNLFKGYSTPGTSTITLIALSDYKSWDKYEKDYFNGQKQAYTREKERIANAFVQRVERKLIPGLSDMIEVMEIGTPLTNLYYTKNPQGAIYGFHPEKSRLKARTPINGIYLASAWSHGGGYTPVMMGGRQAAMNLLTDFKNR
ncbi:MAG: NAD(P)/FAD-dependent oxidoreductase [Desulfobacteraceae bacterium]|nr:NAD(P)/FAD-dependent oxidoreductase [Desulfobacteraceae bacterium]